jgi:hypothetical protein
LSIKQWTMWSLRSQLFILGRLIVVVTSIAPTAILLGQAKPAVKPSNDFQVGATIDFSSADYGRNTLRGFGFYSTYDFRRHLGVEAEFHQLNYQCGIVSLTSKACTACRQQQAPALFGSEPIANGHSQPFAPLPDECQQPGLH